MPNILLKSRELFSNRRLNSLPCGEGLGVGVVVVVPRMSLITLSMLQRRKHAVRFAPSSAEKSSCPYCHPHPQPLPTRGRGADRVCRLSWFHLDRMRFRADPRKFRSRAWFRQAAGRDPVMADGEGEPEPSGSPLLDFARKRNPVQESPVSCKCRRSGDSGTTVVPRTWLPRRPARL
jgi:hypothetical protein